MLKISSSLSHCTLSRPAGTYLARYLPMAGLPVFPVNKFDDDDDVFLLSRILITAMQRQLHYKHNKFLSVKLSFLLFGYQ